jgi:drug/metabolite transporter (DMT)-like permease
MQQAGPRQVKPMPDDGTGQLLRAGIWTLLVGGLAALLTATVFGGIGQHGPHTNSGWLALLLAMMCLPFGCMLTVLGAAKWLRNRRIARVRKT